MQATTLLRDIIYFSNESQGKNAIVNIDWRQAFDRVCIDFMFKVLNRFDFNCDFIKKVKMLYTGCQSAVCINGIMSEYFPVERSIRQGCPMSMIAYILFQEPFLLAIKANASISPIELPNGFISHMVGFADDVSVFVSSDKSVIELDNVIEQFEIATGAELNRNKTFVMGLGIWKERNNWPLDWLQTQMGATMLGIYFCNNYSECVKRNWENVIGKVGMNDE